MKKIYDKHDARLFMVVSSLVGFMAGVVITADALEIPHTFKLGDCVTKKSGGGPVYAVTRVGKYSYELTNSVNLTGIALKSNAESTLEEIDCPGGMQK